MSTERLRDALKSKVEAKTGHTIPDASLAMLEGIAEAIVDEIALGGGGAWLPVGSEIVVAGSAVSSIAGPAIDGDAWGEVMIVADWNCILSAETHLVVRPNNDASGYHATQLAWSTATTIANVTTGLMMSRRGSVGRVYVRGAHILMRGGDERMMLADEMRIVASGASPGVTGSRWTDTDANITSLPISTRNSSGNLVTGIGVGSRFRLYRRTA